MSEIDQIAIKKYTEQFAQISAKVLSQMLSLDGKPEVSEFCKDGVQSEKKIYVSILFIGSLFGEFILAFDEEFAKKAIQKSFGDAEVTNQVIAETFSEILNIIAGEALLVFSSQTTKLTITAPKVHFGSVKYPLVKSGKSKIPFESGTLECHLYIDEMRLDIAESYKTAMSSLVNANDELKVAFKKLEEQQEQLAQSEKLAALGKMAAGVAHEVNTPLATISLAQGNIRDIVAGSVVDRKALAHALDMIEKTVERISRVTNALRSYTSDYAGYAFKNEKVSDLVNTAIEFCEAKLNTQGVQFTKNLLALEIECSKLHISQGILCLLSNSLSAIADLNEKWIRVAVEDKSDTIEIRVTDSGKGIAADIQNKIFDPFFSTQKISESMGLGLSFAKGIMSYHGGTLVLNKSSPNTEFIIELPKIQKRKKPL